jgi:glycosyltransferase involved in cell wall biosynthesis
MSAPLLLDLSHTAHTAARTGIQRVALALWRELGATATPVTFDPHRQAWRALEPWELANLALDSAAKKRAAQWPLQAKLRGKLHRVLRRPSPVSCPLSPVPSGLLVPEVFSAAVGAALPALLAAVPGPRVAVFHDAIALKFPELTPTKTVARFPAYLRELLLFDGIAANSEDSRATLLDYWRWLGIANPPPVVTISLGLDLPAPSSKHSALSSKLPTLLSVGSLEGRKNHLALLEACEQLWSAGAKFELHLIGLVHAQTGRAALARLRALQAAGRPLRYDGPVDDRALDAAYAACAFTVYPSLIEGFGLPVIESLARGKPCVCSAHGALGESARGGGCLLLDDVDPASLATAIDFLLSAPDQLAALSAAAHQRTFKTWSTYAREVTTWMQTLPRHT